MSTPELESEIVEIQCPTSFRPSLIQIKVGAVSGCLYAHEFYIVLSQALPEILSKPLTCWIPDIAWEQLTFQIFLFPKMRQRYFSSTCLFDTDFKELIMKHLLWRNLIDRVMEMIFCWVLLCSFPQERFLKFGDFLVMILLL